MMGIYNTSMQVIVADVSTVFKPKKTVYHSSLLIIASWNFRSGMLWTAPELMASQQTGGVGLSTGTQKGDVYSFAIIVHEILYRAGLFRCSEDDESIPAKSKSVTPKTTADWYCVKHHTKYGILCPSDLQTMKEQLVLT